MITTQNDGVFSAGSVAEGYREYFEPAIFRPWAERLVDFARIRSGQRLLDVACGTGVVARVAAGRLGRNGHVIASDISAGMLGHVSTDYPQDAATLETVQCSATELALPDKHVDAVLCQQGLPFIPDRPAAAREMHRVLRPGGTAAVAVWISGTRVDPFATYAEVLVDHGAEEPYPHAYDIDQYCMSPQAVESALTAAGFVDVDVRIEELTVRWPSAAAAAQAICGTPFYPALTAMSEAQQQAVAQSLLERMTAQNGGPVAPVMSAVFARGTAH